jgi:hypothetical protein
MTTRAAACVREIVAERSSWTGSAADLLQAGAGHSSTDWPKNPRALAGRLRRTQTFLRALGIEITFSREGRAGNRVIRMRSNTEKTVSTVGSVSEYEPWVRTASAADFCDDNGHNLVGPPPVGQVSVTADGADGADANAAFRGSPPIPDLWRRPRGPGAI